jgi:hypothetical protein
MAKNQVGTDKWARLRHVATEDAKEVDSAVAEVAGALGVMADALSNLREHLDLIEAPKSANLKVRIAAARKYAARFRQIANEAPEIVADAISEVYHSLDDVAGAIENLAENMGIELELTPAEEAFGEEGKEEIAEGEKPEDAPEPKVDDEKFEEAEEELESEEAAPAEEKLDEAEGEVEKEASVDTKVADASFITNRDKDAKPEPVEKAEIPEVSVKAAAARAALRLRIAKRHGIEL